MPKLSKNQLELRAAAAAAALALQNPEIENPIPCEDCKELWDFVKSYEHYFDYVLKRLETEF